MPELCRFFGIIITMFYNDHAPAALSRATSTNSLIISDALAY